MSNTVTTLFPDEPRPQSQNCTVDISGNPWNYWRPYNPQPYIQVYPWFPQDTSTTAAAPEQTKSAEPADKDEEEECLTLTIGDVEAMLRRVIREELGTLRIVQGKQ